MEGQLDKQEELGPFGRALPPSLQGLGYKTDGDDACFFVKGSQLGGVSASSVEGCFRAVVGARIAARDGGVEIKVPLAKVEEAGRGMSRVWAEVGSFGEQFFKGGSGSGWSRRDRDEARGFAEGGEFGLGLSSVRRQLGFVLNGDDDDERSYGYGC